MPPSPHAPKTSFEIDAAAVLPQPMPGTDARTATFQASNEFQRIDRPHADTTNIVGQSPVAKPAGRKSPPPAQTRIESPSTFATDQSGRTAASLLDAQPENWLQLHATDLIDRLSRWSADLDAREAGLNARIAKQDLRERQFRLHQQLAETELAEQQRAIDRLRRQIQDQARRLAFQDA